MTTTEMRNNSPAFECLTVTNVQVFPFKEGPTMGHMKALANIVINDQLQLRGLRVMDGEYGLFVSYPTDPFFKGDNFRNLFIPITRQLREHIETCVLTAYQEALLGRENANDAGAEG